LARLLVTGGAGFIGSNFVRHWLQRGTAAQVTVLDALTYAGNLASLADLRAHPGLRFVHGDIRDQTLVESLLRDDSLDTIVHFAAESHVDRSILGPDAFIDTNIVGTHCLLKAARSVWLAPGAPRPHRFHHVSTDEVYGSLGPGDPPFTERHPYAPNSPYSASKAGSDHLVRAYHHTYGLSVTISNCSNNYGPYHFPEKLIPLAILNILAGMSVPVYGDGRNIRDWLHVSDHCRGIERILERGVAGEVYNIGGRSECENINLVRQLCAAADALFAASPQLRARFPHAYPSVGRASAELITFVKDRPGHDRRYAIDDSRIARELQFEPQIPLRHGLGSTLQWYLDNENWWRGVQDGSYQQWIQRQYAG
jgi:dTDP-glucose 4,6-dehydratase